VPSVELEGVAAVEQDELALELLLGHAGQQGGQRLAGDVAERSMLRLRALNRSQREVVLDVVREVEVRR